MELLKNVESLISKDGGVLLIENISSGKYSKAESILKILKGIPRAQLTLDIGHANINNELGGFINKLSSRIGHIHLHYSTGKLDHQFFSNRDRFKEALIMINAVNYDGTVLLETFSVLKNGENVSQNFEVIKKLHISQLQLL